MIEPDPFANGMNLLLQRPFVGIAGLSVASGFRSAVTKFSGWSGKTITV